MFIHLIYLFKLLWDSHLAAFILQEFRDSPVVASASSNLDHGHINPVANGEFTIFTPLSPPHQNNNVFLANQQIIVRIECYYF